MLYATLKKFKNNPSGADHYSSLLKEFKVKSIEDGNEIIESLQDKVIDKPNIVDKKLYVKHLFGEDVMKRILIDLKVKLYFFKKPAEKTRNEIAEMVIKENTDKRVRPTKLSKKLQCDVLLDRLFKDELYIDSSQDMSNIVRSSVMTLLLKGIMEEKIDKSILNSLDFPSLIRLATSRGGEQITVPTLQEVETVLASTYFFYLRQYEGFSEDDAIKKVRNELNVKVGIREIRNDYNVLLFMYSKELYKDSSTISEALSSIMSSIQAMQEKLLEVLPNIETSDEFLKLYKDVNKSFLNLSRSLACLKN